MHLHGTRNARGFGGARQRPRHDEDLEVASVSRPPSRREVRRLRGPGAKPGRTRITPCSGHLLAGGDFWGAEDLRRALLDSSGRGQDLVGAPR